MSLRDFPDRVKIPYKWPHAKPIVRQIIKGRAGYTCPRDSQIVAHSGRRLDARFRYELLIPARP
jgi:hypothetical protein